MYDCVGIGVGPANLSLASLMHKHAALTNVFLDRDASFGWHDGQQLAGATLQVSPLKDLVTLTDPTNEFSFLSYLHEQGRIYHFINARFDSVPRLEFRNYLEWACARNANIRFNSEVLSVEFTGGLFEVCTRRERIVAENVVVGVGTTPHVPEFARIGRSQFHVSDFLRRAGDVGGRTVAVVGGGQSGAEAVLDLITRSPEQMPRQVVWISRRDNFSPIDESPFTNDFFTPSYSDHFYELGRAVREEANLERVLLSDGISESTLREIYQRIYVLRFVQHADGSVVLRPDRNVVAVTGGDDGPWEVLMRPNARPEQREVARVDSVVWATGFRPTRPEFLEPLAGRLEREGAEFRIDEDFAVCWDGPPDRTVFVQNGARLQRGLADPNLSLLAWRSQRILDRLRGVRSRQQLASFISWATPTDHPADLPAATRSTT